MRTKITSLFVALILAFTFMLPHAASAVEGSNGSYATASPPYVVAINPWTYEIRADVIASRATVYLYDGGYMLLRSQVVSGSRVGFQMKWRCTAGSPSRYYTVRAHVEGSGTQHVLSSRWINCQS